MIFFWSSNLCDVSDDVPLYRSKPNSTCEYPTYYNTRQWGFEYLANDLSCAMDLFAARQAVGVTYITVSHTIEENQFPIRRSVTYGCLDHQ